MTPYSFVSILAMLILAAAWLLGLTGLQKKLALHPEWCRKLLSYGKRVAGAQPAGPVSERRAGDGSLRRGPGRIVSGVDRDSQGDLYFVAATGLLFLFSGGDPVLFSVPLVILTFADSSAALVGQRYGRHRFQSAGGTKSLEGSAAFFLTAVAAACVGLRVLADTGPAEALLLSLLLGLHLALVEASAGAGFDNLLIPLTGCLLLRVFLGSPAALLMLHLLAALSAGALAVLIRRYFLRYPIKSTGGA